MADNTTRGRSTDRKRLNKSEPYEVAYAKSDRASPARKALLGKSEGAAAKRSSTSAKRSSTSAKSNGGSAKSSGAAKTGARAAKSSGSAAKRSTASKRASGAAKSASPAMKKTNAEPQRKRAVKASVRGTPRPPKGEKTAENTAPKTMKLGDAIDLLTDDHLAVDALFKRYDKLAKKEAPAAERQPLAAQICAMLKTHTAIEEEIFYPAARRAGIDADMLDEADIEHASAKDLIGQIEAGDPDADHYDAKVKVLGEYINHHVVEEHTEMFPKCRRAKLDLVELRRELESRKAALSPGDVDASEGAAKEPGLLAKIGDTLFARA
jgi:hypothetical protein